MGCNLNVYQTYPWKYFEHDRIDFGPLFDFGRLVDVIWRGQHVK